MRWLEVYGSLSKGANQFYSAGGETLMRDHDHILITIISWHVGQNTYPEHRVGDIRWCHSSVSAKSRHWGVEQTPCQSLKSQEPSSRCPVERHELQQMKSLLRSSQVNHHWCTVRGLVRSARVVRGNIVATHLTQLHITIWNTDLIFFYLFDLFSSFYWAEFDAQKERAQQDFKVPYKVHTSPTPHLHTKDSNSTGITVLLYTNSAWVP